MTQQLQAANPYIIRLERVRNAMQRSGMDYLFLNYGADLTYISGISEPNNYYISKSPGDWIVGLIVGLDHEPIMILTRGFAIKIERHSWIQDMRILPDGADPDQFLASILAELRITKQTMGLGKTVWSQTALSLRAGAPDATFVPVTNAFTDKIREVKDEDEIALMQRAAEITDEAMAATVSMLRIGMTERDVAIEVDYQLRRHGGDKPSFYPGIICVGNGSDTQRHIMERNTDMVLAPGTTVAFDWGVSYKGYASDFGRSVFIGEPRSDALEAYDAITSLNQTLMEEMKDGVISPAGIAAMASEIMNTAGWGDYYMHMGLGHSIGLDVHENPWHRPAFDEPIRTNMCFTIEPKIWKPGVFYVRCEDVVVVGPERSRPLTMFHYDPIVVS